MAQQFVKQQPFRSKRAYHHGETNVYVCVEHVDCKFTIRYTPSKVPPEQGSPEIAWIVHTSGEHSEIPVAPSAPARGVHPRFSKEVDTLIGLNLRPQAIYNHLNMVYKRDIDALKSLPSKHVIAIRKRTITMKGNGPNKIESVADMKEWTEAHSLPALREDALKVAQDTIVVLPGGCYHNDEAEGFCISCPGLLMNAIRASVAWGPAIPLVCDGTYKLTYNGWVLLALGTTHHHYDVKHAAISHQFRPISFMFGKSEAAPNISLLLTSTRSAIQVLHGVTLKCLHVQTDRSLAQINGFRSVFPDAPWTPCWPHISMKVIIRTPHLLEHFRFLCTLCIRRYTKTLKYVYFVFGCMYTCTMYSRTCFPVCF